MGVAIKFLVQKFGKHAFLAPVYILGIFLLFTAMFAGIFPSGSTLVMARYQHITASVSPAINWQDVYIFDYFRFNNNFSQVTNSDIKHDAKLFLITTKVENPKYMTKVVVYIYSKYPEWIHQKVVFPNGTYRVIRLPDPLWHPPIKKVTYKIDPSQPEYITETASKSLMDVMLAAGYSQQDYTLALNIEDTLYGGASPGFTGTVQEAALRYSNIKPVKLYDYVHARNSIFTVSDIKTIEAAAKEADVNPALLVAITGQEESFVPTSWPAANLIRNNPFNVHYSWQDYNTTLEDAATIAANTLHNKLATKPPKGEDSILWINDPNNPAGIYATDTHWAYGVEDIFLSIEQYLGQNVSKSTLSKA